jgi:hypothetical protein
MQGRELSEIQAQAIAPSQAASYSLARAPAGVSYEASSGKLLWIPQRGQAGSYSVVLASASGPSVSAPITVAAVDDSQLALGPPPFAHGDIGYIFIHGATNEDLCAKPADLLAYWLSSPSDIEPQAALRTLACYNGGDHVAAVAPLVAQEIVSAPCGRFNKCILITHSMGGLVAEFISLHARAARAGDPDPSLFAPSALYQQAKAKLLYAISLSSAAGGSKVADILQNPQQFEVDQATVGEIANIVGANDGAYQDLTVANSAGVFAPIGQDPGIPFFMFAGFSVKIDGTVAGAADTLLTLVGAGDPTVFNGDSDMTFLDSVALPGSRGDGLVDFRSACGVASANTDDGPGYAATLAQQFQYCATAPKKPNHFPWAAINLNHFLTPGSPPGQCLDSANPCVSYVFRGGAMQRQGSFDAMTPAQIIRAAVAP